jgi:Ca2+-binding RTX toxin-like protein
LIDRFEAPSNQAPIVKNDKWVLSDTVIPTGTITPTWFLNNDTDPDGSTLYVMNVQGLAGTGLSAVYDGSNHLVGLNGTAVTGNYTLTYDVVDASGASVPASVTLVVLDTRDTGGTPDSIDLNSVALNNTDFSYIDAQGGPDTVTGDITLVGNAGKDIFVGNNGDDTLSGGDGDDQLFGNENTGSGFDTLSGGAGNDLLDGGNGSDKLNGGAGADTLSGGAAGDEFIYSAVTDSNDSIPSNRDTIVDFNETQSGEVINLQAIDAIAGGGDNAFVFGGQTTSVVANQVTWYFDAVSGNTIVQADNSGDTTADMVIVLVGNHTLTAGDFLL